jgi:hypothetical protein
MRSKSRSRVLRQLSVDRDRKREKALETLRRLARPFPRGWHFDREEANERRTEEDGGGIQDKGGVEDSPLLAGRIDRRDVGELLDWHEFRLRLVQLQLKGENLMCAVRQQTRSSRIGPIMTLPQYEREMPWQFRDLCGDRHLRQAWPRL